MKIWHWGIRDYLSIWQAMRTFTDQRDTHTEDELWLGQHFPVFTQGQAGKPEHIIQASSIPIVQSDRGGQVTYHGPGQLIAYVLCDLSRHHWTVRQLVRHIEQAVIHVLADDHIVASTQEKAPGVYVDGAKIASIGLRIRRGCSYHGIALNINMDLSPFAYINPCGHPNLAMTQLNDLVASTSFEDVEARLAKKLESQFHRPN